MALIRDKQSNKKEKIKAELNVEVLQQIQEYCDWAKISDLGFFIEEAASFIFSKDREWKQHQKANKKAAKALA